MPGHIPWRKVDLPLQAQRALWISTTRPDGRPHAIPVWFWWDGASIYFVTKCATQKAANLGDGDDTIILEGAAEIVTDRVELGRVEERYREKYVDPHSGAWATIYVPDADLYRVRVRRVMAWEYGIVATRTDWRLDS